MLRYIISVLAIIMLCPTANGAEAHSTVWDIDCGESYGKIIYPNGPGPARTGACITTNAHQMLSVQRTLSLALGRADAYMDVCWTEASVVIRFHPLVI